MKLLGEMTAISGDRVVSRFRTQQTAALLAYLALHLGKPHLRDTLVDLIWPEDDVDSARTKLRVALSSLRRQFESPGSTEGSVFEATRTSITLRPEAIQTDVATFKSALARDEQTDSSLTFAVNTYRGLLAPALHAQWIVEERENLNSQFIKAALTLSSIRLQDGDHEEALQMAERALRADPWSEDSHIVFMTALAIVRGPHHALTHFQKFRTAFREQLGTEPGKALLDCTRRIQNNEIVQSTSVRTVSLTSPIEPTLAGVAPPIHIPRPLTRYFGRHEDVNRLVERIAATLNRQAAEHVITILGTGGTGKTRLSIEVASRIHSEHHFPVYFVALEDIRHAGDIPGTVSRTLKSDSIADHANTPSLIILDNFEQLLDSGAAPVLSLLNQLPMAVFLITSRQPLNIAEETRLDWLPLPIPSPDCAIQDLARNACVKLFVDRAQRIRPDFQITRRNAESVSAICRSVEGIPLAIEMAAAWTGMYTPSQLLERIESHPLSDRTSTRVERHRTIANVIDWSIQLLPTRLRELFLRLGVFRGSWTAEAVAEICHAGPPDDHESVLECREMLARLRERSLLFAETDARGESLRYRFLETLREFAQENLPDGESEELAERHLRYYVRFATEVRSHLNDADQAAWYDRQALEHANCLAALDRLAANTNRMQEELALASTLQLFWWTRGFAVEGCQRLEQAINRPESANHPKALGRALRAAAILARATGEYAKATTFDERSLDIAKADEDWPAVAMILGGMGNTAKSTGDLLSARKFYAECIITAEEIGQMKIVATAVGNLGNVALREGSYGEAREHYDRSLTISREMGHMEAVAVALGNLATLANYLKDYGATELYARESLEICAGLGDMVGMAASIETLAHAALKTGSLTESVQLHAIADLLRQRAGAPIPPDDRRMPESDIEILRSVLGEVEFEKAWSEARILNDTPPIDAALKLAGLERVDMDKAISMEG